MTKKSLTENQEKEICKRYGPKYSSIQLAKEYNVTKGVILRALKRNGIKRINSRNLNKNQEQKIIALQKDGFTKVAIARELSISPGAVKRVLERIPTFFRQFFD